MPQPRMNRIELRPQRRPFTNPSINPRPPTESGNPPTLDPQAWLTTTDTSGTIDAEIATGQAGDMIVICGYEGAGGSFAAAPSGYTEVFYTFSGTHGLAVWVKIADGTEGSTVNINNQSANTVINTNRIIANGATLSVAGILSNSSAGSKNPPAVMLLESNYVLLAPFHTNGLSIDTIPTGYEYGVNQTTGQFGSDFEGVVTQKLVTGPGTEDPTTYDGTESFPEYIVGTVAIPIAPAPASVAPADHTHVESDITDLPGHSHVEADVSDLSHTTTVAKAGTLIGTRARINFIEGTDITLTVADDSGNDEVDVTITSTASGGGGSGDPYVIEPGLKPPASAHADDDEFTDTNGTDPTTTGWSWGNQTSCTAEIRGGRLRIDGTSSSSRGIHGLFKAFPGTGDVTAAIRCNGNFTIATHGIGVAFLYGTLATPTAIEVARYITAADRQGYWSRYTAYGTFSANRGNTARIGSAPQYLQLRYDATAGTVRGFWSPSLVGDGDWRPFATAASLARPDFYGIVLDDETNGPTGGLQVNADFFRVNWTPDF